MKEPRKIVLILGNGFDLDLGLKTSYKDFWESEYCPKDYPAPLIHHLNQCWEGNLEAVKWYDLENELLNYYKSIPNPTTGDDFLTQEEKGFLKDFSSYWWQCGRYDDKKELIKSLVDKGILLLYSGPPFHSIDDHYKEEALQSPICRDRKALQLIKDGLCNYLKSLKYEQEAKNTVAYQVLQYLSTEQTNAVSIYSFNYTDVKCFVYSAKNASVHYMHGSCGDERIIIGTGDDLMYVETYDFLQKSFDPAFNPPALVEDLKSADEIVIFGHSIGENDRQYFKAFFKQQTDNANSSRKDITIFTRDDNSVIQLKRAMQKMTDGNLSTLYSLNNIQVIRTGKIEDDQQKLYDFLVYHGKDDHATREFIGKLKQTQSAH